MKKLICTFMILSGLAVAGRAQSTTYHALKVDIELGAGDKFTSTVEPHYRVSDNLALGIRFQGAFSATVDLTTEGANNQSSTQSSSSTCITADYYFLDSKTGHNLALFAGGGVGGFAQSDSKNNTSTSSDSFGLFPRIGLETGHFRASIEYNVTGGTSNYVSLNAGFFFGGGKK
jgi:hypothetical protein